MTEPPEGSLMTGRVTRRPQLRARRSGAPVQGVGRARCAGQGQGQGQRQGCNSITYFERVLEARRPAAVWRGGVSRGIGFLPGCLLGLCCVLGKAEDILLRLCTWREAPPSTLTHRLSMPSVLPCT